MILIPLCLMLILFMSITPVFAPKNSNHVATITQWLLIVVAILYAQHPVESFQHTWHFLQFNQINITLSIRWDMLAKIMSLFILAIGFFIYQYANNYLESDVTRAGFLSKLNLILCSVLLLVMSANLLTAFVAWQLIGINLYLTLNHYHHNPKANKAAKKKFVINRIGDCSFLLAIILAYQGGSSTAFTSISSNPHAEIICALLLISVMTKCAQFPFHIWLIDTMETPTPVSALMHAGVINAGGILLTRVSATLTTYHGVTYALLLVGLISAALSSKWMNKQPDTKKKLAYSTMGQMGYMLTQCSLGAFPAAVFHLMAHGFYKASLFLNAGETLMDNKCDKGIKANWTELSLAIFIAISIFLTGILAFKNMPTQIPILMHGFILFTLITLVLSINTNTSFRLPLRLTYYVVITLIFNSYLYVFSEFSELLPQYSYTGITSITAQIILLLLFAAFQARQWLCKPILRPIGHNDNTEIFLRRLLLNPLRSIGNVINSHRHKKSIKTAYKVILVLTVLCFIYGLTYHQMGLTHQKATLNSMTFIFLSIGIIALIFANRCPSIKALIAYISLFELSFINLAWFDGNSHIVKIGLFHLLNISAVLFMLAMLSYKATSKRVLIKKQRLQLPSRVFYFTFALLLLIGIPGTASFISEFYLLNSMISGNPLFVCMYVSLIILISIVIMHSLQLYVFNSDYADFLASPISHTQHFFFLAVIAFNIQSGLYPHLLLRHL